MKSLFRLSSLLFTALALVFSTAPVFTAHAQDTCFSLSADDCNLVKAASTPEAYAKLTAFTMTHELIVSSTNAAGAASGVSIKGNGSYASDVPFVVDSAATEAATGNVTLQDMFSVTVKRGSADGKSTNIEVRIVDGTVYIQLGKQWVSTSLAKLQSGEVPFLSTLGGDPTQFTSSLRSAFEALAGGGVASAERSADTTIDNQKIASFVYHFDLAKAAADGTIGPILKLLSGRLGGMDKLTDGDLAGKKDQLAKAFQNTQFTVTRYVGVDDKLPHGVSIDLTGTLDPKDFVGLSADNADLPTTDPSMGPSQITYHYEFKISGIGNKVAVTAPADAVPMPGLK